MLDFDVIGKLRQSINIDFFPCSKLFEEKLTNALVFIFKISLEVNP